MNNYVIKIVTYQNKHLYVNCYLTI